MSDNKTYYWLKMNEDFFEDDTIKFIREQQNGDKYLIIYLILCLKSLRSEGIVIRIIGNTLVPYDIGSLSKMTGSDFDTVRSAIDLFKSIGLVEILDSGAIHMAQIKELVGKETDSARRMRKKRALEKLEKSGLLTGPSHCAHNVQECDEDVTQRIESRDKNSENKEKIKESERNTHSNSLGSYKNVFLSPEELVNLKEEYPYTYAEQIDHLSEQKAIHGYKFDSDYAVIRKWQREDDWDFKESFLRDSAYREAH